MKDLFGNDTSYERTRKATWGVFQIYRQRFNYMTAMGENSCKTCQHRISGDYHNMRYHKCKLQGLSHSENSDIRLRNVCDNFSNGKL